MWLLLQSLLAFLTIFMCFIISKKCLSGSPSSPLPEAQVFAHLPMKEQHGSGANSPVRIKSSVQAHAQYPSSESSREPTTHAPNVRTFITLGPQQLMRTGRVESEHSSLTLLEGTQKLGTVTPYAPHLRQPKVPAIGRPSMGPLYGRRLGRQQGQS